jgi:hypothetical protein
MTAGRCQSLAFVPFLARSPLIKTLAGVRVPVPYPRREAMLNLRPEP